MRAQRTTISEGKAPTAAQYSGAGKPDRSSTGILNTYYK